MSDEYRQLLDAAIGHLQDLQARGVRHVPASPEILKALRQPVAARHTTLAVAPAPAAPPDVPQFSIRADASQERPPVTPPAPIAAPVTRSVPLSVLPKVQSLPELRAQVLVCTKCPHLAASRKNVVFGVGDPKAQLMFVGEAPGADEDAQGEPFVGAAGQLLTKIIQAMGLSRETVYIANILKCRPDTPNQSSGNRKPTPDEMQTCIPYLHEQIDLIQPRVLVALGATAVEGLLGKTPGITKLRGNWQTYRNIPLMPTYHPSYLLRTMSLADRRRVWEDMLQVMEKLELPINEKQRGYFLRSMGA